MIERQFLTRKIKEFQIEEFMSSVLDKAGYSHTEIQRTPLGEKVIIFTSRPGLIVGKKGANIKDLTEVLKRKFQLENPQIEVAEIENPNLNPRSVARHIIHTFERFGPKRFKSIGYKTLQDIMDSGAIGAEIVISGRGVPSSRAKSWRFKAGYLKKSGDIAENFVSKGFATAHLKSGAIGIKVTILTPDVELPDKIKIYAVGEIKQEVKQEIKQEVKEEKKQEKHEEKKEKKPRKKSLKKEKDGNNKKK